MTDRPAGTRGRPRKPAPDDPALDHLRAEIDEAEAEVLARIRERAASPTQASLIAQLDAEIRAVSLRVRLERARRDNCAAKHETELMIKLTNARDDACGRAWGDELDALHALVVKAGGVHAAIAAELADEEAAP